MHNNAPHVNQHQLAARQITAQAFAAKYSSKIEVYRFLSTDCSIYLPAKDCCTIWFLRGLADGSRTRIKCDAVKVLNVPFFEGLALEDTLKWVNERPNKVHLLRAFPEEEREIRKLPRAWVNNVLYTLDEEYADWVKAVQKARTDKLLAEQKLGIMLDPEILEVF